jgi:hypothetical protein
MRKQWCYAVAIKNKIIFIICVINAFDLPSQFLMKKSESVKNDTQFKESLIFLIHWKLTAFSICLCNSNNNNDDDEDNNNNNNNNKRIPAYVLCQLCSKPADERHVRCQCHINYHRLTHICIVSPSLQQ